MWRCVATTAGAGILFYFRSQLTLLNTAASVCALVFTLLGPHKIWLIYATLPRDLRGLVRLLKLIYSMKRLKARNDTVPKVFMRNVRKHPNKVAFFFEDEKWTFTEVDEYSNRVANYFKECGIKKGDSVAVFMENCVEYVCIWLGLTKLGAVPALINFNQRLLALTHSIKTANCKAIVCNYELQDAIKEVINEFTDVSIHVGRNCSKQPTIPGAKNLDEELNKAMTSCPPEIDSVNFNDNLVYIYTSGTTGLPKAAVIKHSRAIYIVFGIYHLIALKSTDIIYDPLPLYHTAGGIMGVGVALLLGATTVIRRKFSASNYWKECIKYECTAGQYIGEICRYLLNTSPVPEEKHHKIRIMFGNGLRPEIWELFQARFNIPTITEFYGATEGNTSLINIDGKPGAVGFLSVLVPSAYPCMLIKIDKETGIPIRDKDGLCIRCSPGEPGELVGKIVSNDPIRDFHGYSDKKATQKKMASDVFKKGDRAFMSGDILVMDEEGWLYFKDRTGDTFRWRGENVSTTEVEGIVSKASNNAATVVYGVEVAGSEGKAGMAALHDPENKVDLVHLFTEIKKTLPAYARPLFVRKVLKLDMTGTYKLKKTDLRADGYDLDKVKDEIFVLDPKEGYKILTPDFYQSILKGEARL